MHVSNIRCNSDKFRRVPHIGSRERFGSEREKHTQIKCGLRRRCSGWASSSPSPCSRRPAGTSPRCCQSSATSSAPSTATAGTSSSSRPWSPAFEFAAAAGTAGGPRLLGPSYLYMSSGFISSIGRMDQLLNTIYVCSTRIYTDSSCWHA